MNSLIRCSFTAKEIPLTKGKIALVDDEDFERLSTFNWCVLTVGNLSYARRGIAKPSYRHVMMHQEILGKQPGMEIDHIDGNGLNNQKNNLRFVTHRQNCQNRHQKKTSVFPGVFWHTRKKRWAAHVRVNGRQKIIGLYRTEGIAFNFYRSYLEQIGEHLAGYEGKILPESVSA